MPFLRAELTAQWCCSGSVKWLHVQDKHEAGGVCVYITVTCSDSLRASKRGASEVSVDLPVVGTGDGSKCEPD